MVPQGRRAQRPRRNVLSEVDLTAAPQSVWLVAADPFQFVDDSFNVDSKRVKAVVDKLLAAAPQLGIRIPDFDAEARGSGPSGASWREVVGGRSSGS